jgi:hypothetical protein
VEPPTVDRVVDDAIIIAKTAVRMAVKNRIIVDAIREDLDYDPAEMGAVARRELDSLVDQNNELADHQRLARNSSIYRSLAEALRELSMDTEAVAAIVEESREAAWQEISTVLGSRLSARAVGPKLDPSYEREREARLRELISVDLARLELENLPEY